MLKSFRSGLTSYFASALLVLLIASFALWGIGGDVLTSGGNSVAQIGDDKLSLNEYAREFQNKFSEIQQQSGGEVTRDMVIDQGLVNSWVTDLVRRETFSYTAHKLNIRVTDNQLREFIMEIEAFEDSLGEFSNSTFNSIASYQGLTPGEFEERLRRELERQYLITSIISSISIPDAVEKTLVKYLMEERTAEIVTITTGSIKDIPTTDDDTLLKYYEDNTANYMAPEYRDLSFITLSTKDFLGDVTITAEEIEQAMDSNIETSAENEKRSFDQILFDTKDEADKAYTDLESGRSFNEVILASGSTPEDAAVSDNSMQDATDSYGLDAAQAIFTTEKDKYSKSVETDFGWRIFNITNISLPKGESGNLRATTEKNLREEKALDILYNKSELINDELAAGASLSELAETLSLKLKTAVNLDKSGYNSMGNLAAEIPTDPAFLANAFDALEDDEPILEELSNGDYYLLMVDNIHVTSLRPFEEVKSSVSDIWKAEQIKDIARVKANEILEQAQNGASMEDLSKGLTETAYNSVTLPRNDQTGQVTRKIHESIFSLDTGSAKIMSAADGNGFIVVKLLSRKKSDGSMPFAQSSQLKTMIKQEYQQRFLANYWRYLEVNLPVKINQRAINAVHDQLSSREQ